MDEPHPDPLDPVFGALSDATRRSVMAILQAQEATATQLAARFPVTRQAIAKHLQVLCDAGLVRSERSGRETRWTLTPAPLDPALAWMASMGGSFDDRVAALQRHLAERRSARVAGEPPPTAAPAPDSQPPVRIAASARPAPRDGPRRDQPRPSRSS